MANSAVANYASKYADVLAQAYNRASVIQGKVNTEFVFDGVKSIHYYGAVTQPLNTYDRTGANNSGAWRYGSPTEILTDVDTLTLSQDKSFSITIDKGHYKDENLVLRTGRIVKAQIGEQVVPYFDKYALDKWRTSAVGVTGFSQAPTSSTVVQMFVDARSDFVNQNFQINDKCYAYVPTSVYAMLLLNPEFISVEKLGEKHLANGVVGKVAGWTIVEVPDTYFPTVSTKDCYALFTYKDKVRAPTKIAELKTYNDVPGISGALIEGRYYGDAFALKTLVNATSGSPTGTWTVQGILKAEV